MPSFKYYAEDSIFTIIELGSLRYMTEGVFFFLSLPRGAGGSISHFTPPLLFVPRVGLLSSTSA